jgi:thiamine biosynthesis lipoprotein
VVVVGRTVLALALAASVAGAVGAGPAPWDRAAPRAVLYPGRTMGTFSGVTLVTSDSAASAPAARAAHRAFARVDSLMSNWTTTSEVARLNREAHPGPVTVHPEVARVLGEALRVWRGTDGAMDVTVEPLVRTWGFLGGKPRRPSQAELDAALARVGSGKLAFDPVTRRLRYTELGVQIDLGGIAKGYGVDVAAESLKSRGVTAALVDLSGNMVALGAPPGSDRWRIGIRDPRDRMPYFAQLRIRGEAISTSGQYEQFVASDGRTYGHILDPRSGRSAEGLISVTVVAATAMECDAWDTGLFVLGPELARRKASEHREFSVVLVEPGDGVDTVWVEADLKDRFVLEPRARSLFRVEYFE